MSRILVISLLALSGALAAADQITTEVSGPVSTAPMIQPLTLEEAQRWMVYSQVVVVKEKDGIVFDTAEAKNQILVVHSINYFKGANGQLFAIINYLRPRPQTKP